MKTFKKSLTSLMVVLSMVFTMITPLASTTASAAVVKSVWYNDYNSDFGFENIYPETLWGFIQADPYARTIKMPNELKSYVNMSNKNNNLFLLQMSVGYCFVEMDANNNIIQTCLMPLTNKTNPICMLTNYMTEDSSAMNDIVEITQSKFKFFDLSDDAYYTMPSMFNGITGFGFGENLTDYYANNTHYKLPKQIKYILQFADVQYYFTADNKVIQISSVDCETIETGGDFDSFQDKYAPTLHYITLQPYTDGKDYKFICWTIDYNYSGYNRTSTFIPYPDYSSESFGYTTSTVVSSDNKKYDKTKLNISNCATSLANNNIILGELTYRWFTNNKVDSETSHTAPYPSLGKTTVTGAEMLSSKDIKVANNIYSPVNVQNGIYTTYTNNYTLYSKNSKNSFIYDTGTSFYDVALLDEYYNLNNTHISALFSYYNSTNSEDSKKMISQSVFYINDDVVDVYFLIQDDYNSSAYLEKCRFYRLNGAFETNGFGNVYDNAISLDELTATKPKEKLTETSYFPVVVPGYNAVSNEINCYEDINGNVVSDVALNLSAAYNLNNCLSVGINNKSHLKVYLTTDQWEGQSRDNTPNNIKIIIPPEVINELAVGNKYIFTYTGEFNGVYNSIVSFAINLVSNSSSKDVTANFDWETNTWEYIINDNVVNWNHFSEELQVQLINLSLALNGKVYEIVSHDGSSNTGVERNGDKIGTKINEYLLLKNTTNNNFARIHNCAMADTSKVLDSNGNNSELPANETWLAVVSGEAQIKLLHNVSSYDLQVDNAPSVISITSAVKSDNTLPYGGIDVLPTATKTVIVNNFTQNIISKYLTQNDIYYNIIGIDEILPYTSYAAKITKLHTGKGISNQGVIEFLYPLSGETSNVYEINSNAFFDNAPNGEGSKIFIQSNCELIPGDDLAYYLDASTNTTYEYAFRSSNDNIDTIEVGVIYLAEIRENAGKGYEGTITILQSFSSEGGSGAPTIQQITGGISAYILTGSTLDSLPNYEGNILIMGDVNGRQTVKEGNKILYYGDETDGEDWYFTISGGDIEPQKMYLAKITMLPNANNMDSGMIHILSEIGNDHSDVYENINELKASLGGMIKTIELKDITPSYSYGEDINDTKLESDRYYLFANTSDTNMTYEGYENSETTYNFIDKDKKSITIKPNEVWLGKGQEWTYDYSILSDRYAPVSDDNVLEGNVPLGKLSEGDTFILYNNTTGWWLSGEPISSVEWSYTDALGGECWGTEYQYTWNTDLPPNSLCVVTIVEQPIDTGEVATMDGAGYFIYAGGILAVTEVLNPSIELIANLTTNEKAIKDASSVFTIDTNKNLDNKIGRTGSIIITNESNNDLTAGSTITYTVDDATYTYSLEGNIAKNGKTYTATVTSLATESTAGTIIINTLLNPFDEAFADSLLGLLSGTAMELIDVSNSSTLGKDKIDTKLTEGTYVKIKNTSETDKAYTGYKNSETNYNFYDIDGNKTSMTPDSTWIARIDDSTVYNKYAFDSSDNTYIDVHNFKAGDMFIGTYSFNWGIGFTSAFYDAAGNRYGYFTNDAVEIGFEYLVRIDKPATATSSGTISILGHYINLAPENRITLLKEVEDSYDNAVYSSEIFTMDQDILDHAPTATGNIIIYGDDEFPYGATETIYVNNSSDEYVLAGITIEPNKMYLAKVDSLADGSKEGLITVISAINETSISTDSSTVFKFDNGYLNKNPQQTGIAILYGDTVGNYSAYEFEMLDYHDETTDIYYSYELKGGDLLPDTTYLVTIDSLATNEDIAGGSITIVKAISNDEQVVNGTTEIITMTEQIISKVPTEPGYVIIYGDQNGYTNYEGDIIGDSTGDNIFEIAGGDIEPNKMYIANVEVLPSDTSDGKITIIQEVGSDSAAIEDALKAALNSSASTFAVNTYGELDNKPSRLGNIIISNEGASNHNSGIIFTYVDMKNNVYKYNISGITMESGHSYSATVTKVATADSNGAITINTLLNPFDLEISDNLLTLLSGSTMKLIDVAADSTLGKDKADTKLTAKEYIKIKNTSETDKAYTGYKNSESEYTFLNTSGNTTTIAPDSTWIARVEKSSATDEYESFVIGGMSILSALPQTTGTYIITNNDSFDYIDGDYTCYIDDAGNYYWYNFYTGDGDYSMIKGKSYIVRVDKLAKPTSETNFTVDVFNNYAGSATVISEYNRPNFITLLTEVEDSLDDMISSVELFTYEEICAGKGPTSLGNIMLYGDSSENYTVETGEFIGDGKTLYEIVGDLKANTMYFARVDIVPDDTQDGRITILSQISGELASNGSNNYEAVDDGGDTVINAENPNTTGLVVITNTSNNTLVEGDTLYFRDGNSVYEYIVSGKDLEPGDQVIASITNTATDTTSGDITIIQNLNGTNTTVDTARTVYHVGPDGYLIEKPEKTGMAIIYGDTVGNYTVYDGDSLDYHDTTTDTYYCNYVKGGTIEPNEGYIVTIDSLATDNNLDGGSITVLRKITSSDSTPIIVMDGDCLTNVPTTTGPVIIYGDMNGKYTISDGEECPDLDCIYYYTFNGSDIKPNTMYLANVEKLADASGEMGSITILNEITNDNMSTVTGSADIFTMNDDVLDHEPTATGNIIIYLNSYYGYNATESIYVDGSSSEYILAGISMNPYNMYLANVDSLANDSETGSITVIKCLTDNSEAINNSSSVFTVESGNELDNLPSRLGSIIFANESGDDLVAGDYVVYTINGTDYEFLLSGITAKNNKTYSASVTKLAGDGIQGAIKVNNLLNPFDMDFTDNLLSLISGSTLELIDISAMSSLGKDKYDTHLSDGQYIKIKNTSETNKNYVGYNNTETSYIFLNSIGNETSMPVNSTWLARVNETSKGVYDEYTVNDYKMNLFPTECKTVAMSFTNDWTIGVSLSAYDENGMPYDYFLPDPVKGGKTYLIEIMSLATPSTSGTLRVVEEYRTNYITLLQEVDDSLDDVVNSSDSVFAVTSTDDSGYGVLDLKPNVLKNIVINNNSGKTVDDMLVYGTDKKVYYKLTDTTSLKSDSSYSATVMALPTGNDASTAGTIQINYKITGSTSSGGGGTTINNYDSKVILDAIEIPTTTTSAIEVVRMFKGSTDATIPATTTLTSTDGDMTITYTKSNSLVRITQAVVKEIVEGNETVLFTGTLTTNKPIEVEVRPITISGDITIGSSGDNNSWQFDLSEDVWNQLSPSTLTVNASNYLDKPVRGIGSFIISNKSGNVINNGQIKYYDTDDKITYIYDVSGAMQNSKVYAVTVDKVATASSTGTITVDAELNPDMPDIATGETNILPTIVYVRQSGEYGSSFNVGKNVYADSETVDMTLGNATIVFNSSAASPTSIFWTCSEPQNLELGTHHEVITLNGLTYNVTIKVIDPPSNAGTTKVTF